MRILLLVLLLSSCTKEVSKTDQFKEVVADTLSSVLMNVLQCENRLAIKEDISKVIGLEKNVEHSFIAKGLCAPLVRSIVPVVLKAGVPANWKCSLTTLNESLESLISRSCGQ